VTSPFENRVLVVTGALNLLSLQDLEAVITAAGGRVAADVSRTSDVLVVSDKPGRGYAILQIVLILLIAFLRARRRQAYDTMAVSDRDGS